MLTNLEKGFYSIVSILWALLVAGSFRLMLYSGISRDEYPYMQYPFMTNISAMWVVFFLTGIMLCVTILCFYKKVKVSKLILVLQFMFLATSFIVQLKAYIFFQRLY